jgi:integrase/recombinase XerC
MRRQVDGAPSRAAVQPIHVATYLAELGRIPDPKLHRPRTAPTLKARLAAIHHRLVVGRVVPVNPAASVRGPRHVIKKGKTPVLSPDEARRLLDSVDISTDTGLRDRALIGLMVHSFARVGGVCDESRRVFM